MIEKWLHFEIRDAKAFENSRSLRYRMNGRDLLTRSISFAGIRTFWYIANAASEDLIVECPRHIPRELAMWRCGRDVDKFSYGHRRTWSCWSDFLWNRITKGNVPKWDDLELVAILRALATPNLNLEGFSNGSAIDMNCVWRGPSSLPCVAS